MGNFYSVWKPFFVRQTFHIKCASEYAALKVNGRVVMTLQNNFYLAMCVLYVQTPIMCFSDA